MFASPLTNDIFGKFRLGLRDSNDRQDTPSASSWKLGKSFGDSFEKSCGHLNVSCHRRTYGGYVGFVTP